PTGSMPCAAKRSSTSALLRIATSCALSLSMTDRGVAAGASIGYHVDASNPRKPDSATVGTAGNADERFAPATASAMIFPVLICGSTLGMVGNQSDICPDNKAAVAWPITLYGTCTS